ncbi:MAG: prolyl oligopeptidase family serine peptidase, partial [Chthoniobacteraceae bacterium]
QDNKDKARAASPLTYVSADDPPFLIMHGDADPVVPHQQSVVLNEALTKAGVQSRLETLAGSGHGDRGFRTPETFKAVREFFSRTLKK